MRAGPLATPRGRLPPTARNLPPVLVSPVPAPPGDPHRRPGAGPASPPAGAVPDGQADVPAPLVCDWSEGAHLDLLGADFDEMSGIEFTLEHKLERERLLTNALAPLRGQYDYI